VTATPKEIWQAQRQHHLDVVLPFTTAFRKRRARGTPHPVYDFLFTYYTLSTTKLEQWRPGYGQLLEAGNDPATDELLGDPFYVRSADGIRLTGDFLQPKHIKQLLWIRALCGAITNREPRFACYGLHEWAMTYKTSDIRHDYPLRLSPDEIAKAVDSISYCCSHFDAFRFSSPAARNLNVLQPTSETRLKFEQGGCLHANMDLYKWSYKLIPLVSSELLRDCFLLALQTREIDMRASPYDFSSLGFAAIAIETAEGREEYRAAQKQIAENAQPLRRRLLDLCEQVLADVSPKQIAAVSHSLDSELQYA